MNSFCHPKYCCLQLYIHNCSGDCSQYHPQSLTFLLRWHLFYCSSSQKLGSRNPSLKLILINLVLSLKKVPSSFLVTAPKQQWSGNDGSSWNLVVSPPGRAENSQAHNNLSLQGEKSPARLWASWEKRYFFSFATRSSSSLGARHRHSRRMKKKTWRNETLVRGTRGWIKAPPDEYSL